MKFERLLPIAEKVTAVTFAELPGEIRQKIQDVPVIFGDLPDPPELDPELLGLYDPGLDDAPAPRIFLWLENLWDYSEGNLATFQKEVRQTLLHEIGHHLGWDEDELDARGLL